MPDNKMLDIRVGVDKESRNVTIGVDNGSRNISIGVDRGGAAHPTYPGPYFVEPMLYEQQELDTTGMLMSADVTVDSIRITETSNPQGGRTVVIV